RGVIVEIIQPDFAPRDHLGMPRQSFHVLIRSLIRKSGFMRMYAESRVNEVVFLRQPNPTINLGGSITIADGDNSLHPSLSRPRNHLLAVRIEPLAIKMRVRIYKH